MQGADSPIRIRFEYPRYPHWGARSGYTQFIQHLTSHHFRTMLHGTSNADSVWLRPLLRRLIRRGGMPRYNLSDLNAEVLALAACIARRTDIVHFLEGESSLFFLPRLVRLARLSKIRTVVTFHQAPQIACGLVNEDVLRSVDQVVLVSPSQVRKETGRFRCLTVGHWLREWNVLREVACSLPECLAQKWST